MNRLRETREEANLSRSKLAAVAGMDSQTIYKIEQAGQRPNVSTAQALARALSDALGRDIRLDDLFPQPEEASA